jgi:hypothetical protein
VRGVNAEFLRCSRLSGQKKKKEKKERPKRGKGGERAHARARDLTAMKLAAQSCGIIQRDA